MDAFDLKTMLGNSLSFGKGFAPITEYIFINKNVIKVTDMEAYLETTLNEDLPFSGCVLAETLKKFLNSVGADVDLTFITTENVLTISYGKRNKFAIPMEPLKDFPDSPSIKYNGATLICSISLTEDFIKVLETASKFAHTVDSSFNGVYLKNNKAYSSNREIIYVGDVDVSCEDSIFIPFNFIKLLTKFKKTFNLLEVYSCGFKATGFGSTLYYANYENNAMPDFDRVFSRHEDFIEITVTEELKNSIDRISLFDERVDICMKDKTINIVTNNISESIDITDSFGYGEYSFKFNTVYLKKLVECKTVLFTQRSDDKTISAIKGIGDNYKLLCAVCD